LTVAGRRDKAQQQDRVEDRVVHRAAEHIRAEVDSLVEGGTRSQVVVVGTLVVGTAAVAVGSRLEVEEEVALVVVEGTAVVEGTEEVAGHIEAVEAVEVVEAVEDVVEVVGDNELGVEGSRQRRRRNLEVGQEQHQ